MTVEKFSSAVAKPPLGQSAKRAGVTHVTGMADAGKSAGHSPLAGPRQGAIMREFSVSWLCIDCRCSVAVEMSESRRSRVCGRRTDCADCLADGEPTNAGHRWSDFCRRRSDCEKSANPLVFGLIVACPAASAESDAAAFASEPVANMITVRPMLLRAVCRPRPRMALEVRRIKVVLRALFATRPAAEIVRPFWSSTAASAASRGCSGPRLPAGRGLRRFR